ncbi:unnamed protein product [Arabis nemorensis]|uniref:Uncharacterized protein n=1 Tax=Arabis nemorensis TaxID=586526 RepID=A0A565CCR8_9BRAS|nr:unnamed protein product [Arabis nemorensis]
MTMVVSMVVITIGINMMPKEIVSCYGGGFDIAAVVMVVEEKTRDCGRRLGMATVASLGKRLLLRFNGATCLIANGPFHKQREFLDLINNDAGHFSLEESIEIDGELDGEEEEEFSYACVNAQGSSIISGETFEDGQIRPSVENDSEEGIEEGNDGISVIDGDTWPPTKNYDGDDLAGQEIEEIEIWVSRLN